MTSRAFTPAQPSFYLDLPTLHGALDGARPPELARLFPWIERVAEDANFCLSLAHVGEMSMHPDRRRMEELAAWLDRLPIVWVRSGPGMQRDEAVYWLRVAVGISSSEPFAPFARSLAESAGFVDAAASVALPVAATVSEQLRALWRVGWPRFQEGLVEQGGVRRTWRAAMREEILGESRFRVATREQDDLVRSLAAAAHDLLVLRRDTAYRSTGTSRRGAADALLACFRSDSTAMPRVRMGRAFDEPDFGPGVGHRPREHEVVSARMHATVGAAYCDVVACNQAWTGALGAVRSGLGRGPTIVLAGHEGGARGFVEELMSTWRTPRAEDSGVRSLRRRRRRSRAARPAAAHRVAREGG